jgi:hypothetical protein
MTTEPVIMPDEYWTAYEARCKDSADEQGVTDIADHLRLCGLDVVVEQTGGFCMVPTVYGETHYAMITLADDCDPGGNYLVGIYESEGCGEPAKEYEFILPNKAADLIRRELGLGK